MKILVAEDSKPSLKLLVRALEQLNFEPVTFSDGLEAWEYIIQTQNPPQLMILDWEMPGLDGNEICRKIRKLKKRTYVYIILLTARSEKKEIIAGLESGADDYITKPFDKEELEVRIRAGRRVLDLQDKLLNAYARLRKEALRDPLTGLHNRRSVKDMFDIELSRAVKNGFTLSVVLLDIDHFKQINDKYGHVVGDTVLCKIATCLNDSVRLYDIVSRYGGEEFLLIFPECSLKNAVAAANRIREKIEKDKHDLSEGIVSITVSMGVTTFHDMRMVSQKLLIETADRALYEAKNSGRNRVCSKLIEE